MTQLLEKLSHHGPIDPCGARISCRRVEVEYSNTSTKSGSRCQLLVMAIASKPAESSYFIAATHSGHAHELSAFALVKQRL